MIFTQKPVIFVLIALAFFVGGFFVGKMLKKEKFEEEYEEYEDYEYKGSPGTVVMEKGGLQKLPPVQQNLGVTDHDYHCARNKC
jgi:hypothetical protein